MLKDGIETVKKKGIQYIVNDGKQLVTYKPWLGDAFSFLYDAIMKNSVFPKKFGGEMHRHYEILQNELKDVHEQRILELATGSGSAVNFLPNDNCYTGTDISPGLLKKAVRNFENTGFVNAAFYVSSAENLPFNENMFDIILCMLSLNFFENATGIFHEIKRVAKPDAVFMCSVPVPERKKTKSPIRGRLYSEKELDRMCQETGLRFEAIPSENGALLYFKAFC